MIAGATAAAVLAVGVAASASSPPLPESPPPLVLGLPDVDPQPVDEPVTIKVDDHTAQVDWHVSEAVEDWDAAAGIEVVEGPCFWEFEPCITVYESRDGDTLGEGRGGGWGWSSHDGTDSTIYLNVEFGQNLTDSEAQSMACHELGHAIGIRGTHRSSGETCMVKGDLSTPTPDTRDLQSVRMWWHPGGSL